MSVEPRKRRNVERRYANDAIEVEWEPALCIHTRACIRALPQVFDAQGRPWIRVDAADAEAIADAVVRCPTGALRFRRLDGGAQEQPEDPTVVDPRPNGPLFVRGRIRVVGADGEAREATRVALCRCGGSSNKPFCDGTHRTIGFRTHDS